MNVIIGALVSLYAGGVIASLLVYERISEADLTRMEVGASIVWPWPLLVKAWQFVKPVVSKGLTLLGALLAKTWELVKARVWK